MEETRATTIETLGTEIKVEYFFTENYEEVKHTTYMVDGIKYLVCRINGIAEYVAKV